MSQSNEFDEDATLGVERAERSLQEAVSLARDRLADRDDVVVEMKAAERGRLDLLVDELRPLIDEVDPDDGRFEFGLSNGPRPRLWIDATTYVQMGTDRRTYRLVKDRLHDRRLLAETGELSLMADAVSAYIGERVLDRQRALEGEWEDVRERRSYAEPTVTTRPRKRSWWRGLLSGFLQVIAAVAVVLLGLAVYILLFPNAFPS